MMVAAALLAHLTNRSRTQLLTHLDIKLSSRIWAGYCQLLARVAEGEPLAYLTGECEFFGLPLAITPDVLVPRPETELLIEETLAWAANRPTLCIADVGTGSGAIAITLAVHLSQAEIAAVDVSRRALRIVKKNAMQHSVLDRICLIQSDLLGGVIGPFDVIVANLPYVQTMEMPEMGGWEPHLALDGGPDGVRLISALLQQAPSRMVQPSGMLLLEIGANQSKIVGRLAKEAFPGADIAVLVDLAGLDRIVRVQTR